MKYFALLLCCMMAFAQGEKTPDTREGHVFVRSGSEPGDLDGSQTFDRRFLVTYDGTCSAANSDSSNNGVSYMVFNISSPVTENLDAEVVLGTLGDSVLFLYCDGFDPLNPAANIVAWDDDGGVGFGSHIAPGDGVEIQAGQTYQLVVSGFNNTHMGDFTMVLGGNAVFGQPVTIPTMSEWGLIVFAVLMIGSGLYLRRRTVKVA
ncbi:MAG: IPTL-CTERM sorting domain-containing protein [Acidobacteria bacterium]|nr:IPTL-CTERM sorting domain-containing protein [Acidobacteriota bacterium]MCB9397906.1 IPTL-CTERM sorting domain-containing protein [Acidobacteriota bacterium]